MLLSILIKLVNFRILSSYNSGSVYVVKEAVYIIPRAVFKSKHSVLVKFLSGPRKYRNMSYFNARCQSRLIAMSSY